jgi:chromosome segregation ATPase
LETVKAEKETLYSTKLESLHTAEAEPGRLQRQIASIENASVAIKSDEFAILKKLQVFQDDSNAQVEKKAELLKLKTNILEKLELNRQTLEEREKDIQAVSSNLEKAKAQSHDHITKKLELNIRKKELDNHLRHANDSLLLITKDYESLTRQMKKRTIVLDLVKQNIPGLESQLKDQEMLLKNSIDERNGKKKESTKLKDEIDYHVARLLAQEGVETDKKKELEHLIEDVDDLETKVANAIAEGKKQSKLLSLLSAQRDIKARENSRIESKDKEAKHQVRTKELVILDLTKRCNEITNRLKEFSALYEVVKNERNKYVNLIQSSAQALAEMREKIRILQNEVEILSNERAAKDLALTKEKNAHQQAQNQRDALRQDLNRLLSEYRSRQGTVEQQIQEIDKLNVVINNLEKEMLQLKSRYEHAVEERNITGVQLIDRNDELCILYERSNQQLETLKKGEMILIKLEENIRLLRLYYEELNRKYIVATRKVPFKNTMEKKIIALRTELEKENKLTEEFSAKLEDPSNLTRWRPLEGTDLDLEQLISKIQILEKRLDEKRENVLQKELVLEEITNLTEKLRNQALSKRENAKLLADELNDLHSKIRDITKKMLASVSELSMYQVSITFFFDSLFFLFFTSVLLFRQPLYDCNKRNFIVRNYWMMLSGS